MQLILTDSNCSLHVIATTIYMWLQQKISVFAKKAHFLYWFKT
jgi:hypothetical protein